MLDGLRSYGNHSASGKCPVGGSLVDTMSNQDGDQPFWRDDDSSRDGVSAGDADRDRAAILARRKRFVAAALSSISLGAATADCQPQVCLSIRPDDAEMYSDAQDAQPAEAQACLAARPDVMDSDASDDAADAAPMPCLDIAPSDGGEDSGD